MSGKDPSLSRRPATPTRPSASPQHIKELIPDPGNRRAHNPRNLGMITDALREVGMARSIVIDEDNVILAGNGVIEAAADVGITRMRVVEADGEEVIAVRRTGLTPEQKRALAIYDNRTAELATWNVEQLLADQAAGLPLQPWWTPEEAASLLKASARAGRTDPDDIPVARATDIQRGDLFELGPHQVLCGDCTDLSDVERLLRDRAVDLVLTDPPYGIGVKYGTFVDSAENVRTLIDRVMPLLLRYSVVLLTPGITEMWTYPRPTWLLAWVHPAGMGNCPWGFTSIHPILAYGNDPYLQRSMGGRPTALVLAADRQGVNEHPTAKPIAVWQWLLERGSPLINQHVYDPFAGAGTTVIAAEQLQRRASVMELHPPFVQVIIDRWEAFTGQKAVKVGEAVRG